MYISWDIPVRAEVAYDCKVTDAASMHEFCEIMTNSNGFELREMREDGTRVISDANGNLFRLCCDENNPPMVYILSMERHMGLSISKKMIYQQLDYARDLLCLQRKSTRGLGK